MIELRQIGYRYPDTETPVLRAIDLRVDEGEMLLVAGPSGCGKSSLLRLLNGLIPHFHGGTLSGELRVAGLDPVRLGPRGMSGSVGFVHQNPEGHFVTRRVEDELAFAMENHGLPLGHMRRRVEEVLDQLTIAHLRDRDIDTLSGGERQRVAIGAVLTLQPQVLVLDEPTSQLDPQSAEDVLRALRTLNEDLGLTVVLAEHRLERVVEHADRLLLMSADRPPRLGTPAETLIGSPLAPPLVRLWHRLGRPAGEPTLKATRRSPEFKALRRRIADVPELLKEPDPPPTTDHRTARRNAQRPAAVDAQGLWLTYDDGHEGLRGLDLRPAHGTVTALLGRNGAGKSTLLKTLVGLLKPDQGRVSLRPDAGSKAVDPHRTELAQVAQQVGFVPQNPSRLLFHDTVTQELEWSLKQRQAGTSHRDDLQTLCRELDILHLGPRHPRELSTGERQRVALATALAGGPSLLLLDEPTRGLDIAIKERLAGRFRRLSREGVTLLIATHDVELVARCADRVALLAEGRVVTEGPWRQMLDGSTVFSTRIHRLFRNRHLHTVEDLEPLMKQKAGARGCE